MMTNSMPEKRETRSQSTSPIHPGTSWNISKLPNGTFLNSFVIPLMYPHNGQRVTGQTQQKSLIRFSGIKRSAHFSLIYRHFEILWPIQIQTCMPLSLTLQIKLSSAKSWSWLTTTLITSENLLSSGRSCPPGSSISIIKGKIVVLCSQ